MKTIPIALAAHLEQHLTTLATCWRVTRLDGMILGFTDHDRDLYVDDGSGFMLYRSSSGYTATDVASGSNLDTDNLELVGLLRSPSITEDDLRAGRWDGAQINIFMVNWADVTMGVIKMRVGHIGQVTQGRNVFRAELLGLMYAYQQSIGNVTQPGCRATFGDQRCGINLAGSPSLTFTGTADSFDQTTLSLVDAGRAEADDFFAFGTVTFTSGLNANLLFEIKRYTVGNVALQTVPPFAIAAGDTYSIQRGCGKSFDDWCVGVYNNGVNFRGEPHLRGNDQLAQVGRSR